MPSITCRHDIVVRVVRHHLKWHRACGYFTLMDDHYDSLVDGLISLDAFKAQEAEVAKLS